MLALVSDCSMRIWSFAYFIPQAIEFESEGDFTSEQILNAMKWTSRSMFRLPLDLAALAAVAIEIGRAHV